MATFFCRTLALTDILYVQLTAGALTGHPRTSYRCAYITTAPPASGGSHGQNTPTTFLQNASSFLNSAFNHVRPNLSDCTDEDEGGEEMTLITGVRLKNFLQSEF